MIRARARRQARPHWVRTTGVLAALAVAAIIPACSLTGTPSGYDIKARFVSAIDVYPNSSVRVQGISVGQILKVQPRGRHVLVTMRIKNGTKLPADAGAALVPQSLLGERYVQLTPVYNGGPVMKPNAVIPQSRTSVPSEFDDLLRSLRDFAGQIKPKNATGLVRNLADLVSGQGRYINDLIDSGSGTLRLLADKSTELGDIIDSLSELSSTLQGHTAEIQHLIEGYNTLSGTLAGSANDISRVITALNDLASQVSDLLERHEQPLQFDVGQLTHATRSLDRNFDSVSLTLSSVVKLFAAAQRAYDPGRNVLNLNNAMDNSSYATLIGYRLRDRLAGICRRIPALQTLLPNCGDVTAPDNPFNQLVGQLINGLTGQPASATAATPSNAQGTTPSASTTAAPSPNAAAPSAPDLLAMIQKLLATAGAKQLGDQVNALRGLDWNLLSAIPTLNSDQLDTLAKLTPKELAGLKKVPADKLATVLDRIRLHQLDPRSLVSPVLPPLGGNTGDAGLNNLVGGVLNGLSGVGS